MGRTKHSVIEIDGGYHIEDMRSAVCTRCGWNSGHVMQEKYESDVRWHEDHCPKRTQEEELLGDEKWCEPGPSPYDASRKRR